MSNLHLIQCKQKKKPREGNQTPFCFPLSHLLAATKLNDLLHKVFSLLPHTLQAISYHYPTATNYLCCTGTHGRVVRARQPPPAGWKKHSSHQRECSKRSHNLAEHPQSPRQMPAHSWKIIYLVLRKLYTLKKEINPGHHCLNLKYPGWQSFRIYSLALDVSLFPFSHSRYLASPSYSFYLFTKMSLFLINIQTQGS